MKKLIYEIIVLVVILAICFIIDKAIINSNLPDWWKFVLLR